MATSATNTTAAIASAGAAAASGVASDRSVIADLLTRRDPRVADWVTVKDPKYIVILILGYLYLAKVWGPRFMRDRKPYKLNHVLQVYNVFQVLSNVYFCGRLAHLAFFRLDYSPLCQGLTYRTDADSLNLLSHLYYYLLVRVIDFADTLFFILKRKFSHISHLHVIHHTMVVAGGWQYMNLGADGQTVVGVCLNSSIHIVMYTYYFLAALGPHVQKYLWWKRYLTRVQIVQFVVMMVHACVPLIVDCGYPRSMLLYGCAQVFVILCLFVNFYVQNYIVQSRTARQAARVKAAATNDNDSASLKQEASVAPANGVATASQCGDLNGSTAGMSGTKAQTELPEIEKSGKKHD